MHAPSRSPPPTDLPPLHVVTDDEVLHDDAFLERAAAVLDAGGTGVALHVRGHRTQASTLHRIAEILRERALRASASLLVNDRVDIALAVDADGVQLGRRSLPLALARALVGSRWIGYSAHAGEEAVSAAEMGTDFVVVGTIYRTASHPARAAAGPDLLRAAAAAARVPVFGIGGITPERVPELCEAGAAGVAVLGGVWRAADAAASTRVYLAALATSGRTWE